MGKDINYLAELFSASIAPGSKTKEIRKKNQSQSKGNITTYDVVAQIEKNQKLKVLDKKLSSAEIDFIRRQFCK